MRKRQNLEAIFGAKSCTDSREDEWVGEEGSLDNTTILQNRKEKRHIELDEGGW